MFKKITGLVLGIALFTMCPLTAAAAPMVPAPYTADQLVDLSRAALAGVSSYHVDSVESTEFTYPATPQANFPMWRPASSPQPPAVYIIRLWKVLPPAEVPRQKLWSGIPLLRETL